MLLVLLVGVLKMVLDCAERVLEELVEIEDLLDLHHVLIAGFSAKSGGRVGFSQ